MASTPPSCPVPFSLNFLARGYIDFAAGLTCGLSGIASGWSTGICGDYGVRATCHEPKFFVGMILALIFAGVMGLYGLIVALTMRTSAGLYQCHLPCCEELPSYSAPDQSPSSSPSSFSFSPRAVGLCGSAHSASRSLRLVCSRLVPPLQTVTVAQSPRWLAGLVHGPSRSSFVPS